MENINPPMVNQKRFVRVCARCLMDMIRYAWHFDSKFNIPMMVRPPCAPTKAA